MSPSQGVQKRRIPSNRERRLLRPAGNATALNGRIDALLTTARVPTPNAAARRWLRDALETARSIHAGAASPRPAEHNAPLDAVRKAADRLSAALARLKNHPHSHRNFWRHAAFGPIRGDIFERPDVLATVEAIARAAREGRLRRIGRPPDRRKQHIVDLALGFCVRFSPKNVSRDVNNFFPQFAGQFFQEATGVSIDVKGQGIERQINAALRRLPIQVERAEHLNKTRHN